MIIKQTNSMSESEKIAATNSNNQYLQALSYVAVGTIYPFAGETPPDTFMLCDGTELNVDEYSELFEIIGYKYGGSGDKFNLPDLKGRTLVGLDGANDKFDSLGKTGGEAEHTLTVAEMPEHAHFQKALYNPNNAVGSYTGLPPTSSSNPTGSDSVIWDSVSTTFTGGSSAHNNMPPYSVINYIIKVMQGIGTNDFRFPVEQNYNPESENAQSGIAVADGIEQHNADEAAHTEIVADIVEKINGKSDKIVNSASGENILLTDSSNYKLQGLTVYGNSTQDSTPTPDAPIDIVSAGASGSVEVKILGNNLAESVYIDTYVLKQYQGVFFIKANLKPSTQYTISFKGAVGNKYYINEALFDYKTVTVNDGITTVTISTVDAISKDNSNQHSTSRGWIILKNNQTQENKNIFNEIMFNEGNTALPYEPYTEQTLTLSTPNELRAVGDYADYIDLEKGVRVQQTYRATEKNFVLKEWDNGAIVLYTPIETPPPKPNTTQHSVLCSISNSYVYSWDITSSAHHFVQASGQRLVVVLPKTYTTVEQAQPIMDAGFEFLYILATPIETPLTDEEIAYYKALHTNYPNTTVLNSDGTNMDVFYVADTKLYIDNKFAELQALVLEG